MNIKYSEYQVLSKTAVRGVATCVGHGYYVVDIVEGVQPKPSRVIHVDRGGSQVWSRDDTYSAWHPVADRGDQDTELTCLALAIAIVFQIHGVEIREAQ